MQYYNVAQAASRLGVSTRTIHRYIKANLFDGLVILEHPQRNDYLFTEDVIKRFNEKRGKLPAEPKKEKRAYYRRAVKGKHSKRKS